MKIATIVGARPQFVKAAAVSSAFKRADALDEVLIDTGQHYDDNMAGVFYEQLGLNPPAHALGVGSGSHGEQTGRMLQAIEPVLQREKPDCVLVYGDTNSTLAGALTAAKLHIPLAHVEAGLRSFDRRMPEEVNRVLTDHASDLLFAPTGVAVENLANEGIADGKVHLVGDVMFDAARLFGEHAHTDRLAGLGLEPGSYALATVHRAENTDDAGRLRAIFSAFAEAAAQCPIVLPLHPRTRAALECFGMTGTLSTAGLHCIEPVGYMEMVALERQARVIVTDSGGVQKEAYFVGVPCITLRDTTEWTETVETGWNRLVPPVEAASIVKALLTDWPKPDSDVTLYGDGKAAESVRDILLARAA